MPKLIDKIKKIPKDYYSLMDIRKIAGLKDEILKVSLSRLVTNKQLHKIGQGLYTADSKKIDWEKFSTSAYAPSYLSFEYALARYGILSQKPHHLTLATTKRTKTISTTTNEIIYHHLNPVLYWGFINDEGTLIAEPEKAFLDLAYLSLNGYASFDVEEMNLQILNKTKLNKYLTKFKSKKLQNLLKKYI